MGSGWVPVPCLARLAEGIERDVQELKVALLGLGPWGQNVARALRCISGVRLVGTYDPKPIRLDGIPDYPSESELVAKSGAEATLIATPPETHAALAHIALTRAHPVFVEKPLSTNLTDAKTLAQIGGRRVMVGHLLTYHPSVQHISLLIASGALGSPLSYHAWRHSLPRPRSACSWWNLGVHDIYLTMRWLGWPTGVKVHREYTDHQSTVGELSFPDGGHATINVSDSASTKQRRIVVRGPLGHVEFDDLSKRPLRYCFGSVGAKSEQPLGAPPLERELEHFAAGCADLAKHPDGPVFLTDAEEGARVVELLQLGQKSLELGSWLRTSAKAREFSRTAERSSSHGLGNGAPIST